MIFKTDRGRLRQDLVFAARKFIDERALSGRHIVRDAVDGSMFAIYIYNADLLSIQESDSFNLNFEKVKGDTNNLEPIF